MFAASDSMVVIIDDRIDVWENQPNVVKVDAYRFWRDVGDINSPPGDSPQLHSQPQRNPSTHGTPSSDQNATAISNQGRSEQATASEASAAPEETMEAPSSEIPVDQPSEAVSSSSLPVEDVVEANVAVVKDGTGMDKDSDTSSDSDSDSDSTTSDSEASGDNSVDSAAGPLADQGADSAPRLDDKDCAIESSDDQLQSSGGSDDSLSSAFGKAEEEGLRRVQEQHDNEEAARAVAVAAAAEAAAVTDGPAQTERKSHCCRCACIASLYLYASETVPFATPYTAFHFCVFTIDSEFVSLSRPLLTTHICFLLKCPDMRGIRIRERDTEYTHTVQFTFVPSNFRIFNYSFVILFVWV